MTDETSPAPRGDAQSGRADAAEKPERASDFERYALLAALTLVIVGLVAWDRWQDRAPRASAPPPDDRTLRVRIGGDAPPRAPGAAPRVADDPPPAPVAPPPAPKRTYTVKKGDTLDAIARRELGSASRAREIAELNQMADPSKLKLDQVLELPAK